jgi:tRNA threonylcarbamoyladenosine biosynthesis protein TsaB
VGVAQGLALALDIPVLAVSNLKTLAFTAYQKLQTNMKQTILVATDARMNEVYSARYEIKGNKIKSISKEKVSSADEVELQNTDAYIGSGFVVYPTLKSFAQTLSLSYDYNVYSQAKNMLLMVKDNFKQLANKVDVIEPVYLREP